MKVWLYTLTWNNEDILPYLLRHYSFCEKIIFYDDGSTDRTQEMFLKWGEQHPTTECIWRTYNQMSGNQFREDVRTKFKDECWKEARGQADWVLIIDPDEFLWCADFMGLLARCKEEGASILLPTGYEMVSLAFPPTDVALVDVIKRGVRNDLYSKPAVFDPNKLTDIIFDPGCHSAHPTGSVLYNEPDFMHTRPVKPYPALIIQRFVDQMGNCPPDRELKLLHYRFLGPERVGRLWEGYKPRMSQVNIQHGWDRHCYLPPEEQQRIFKLLMEQAIQVVQ